MNPIAMDKDHHLPIIAVIHSSVSYLSMLKLGGFRRDLCAMVRQIYRFGKNDDESWVACASRGTLVGEIVLEEI